MSAIHEELILRAARELEVDKYWEFTYPSKEKAHSEYVVLKRTIMKFTGRSVAIKALTISREGNRIRLEMGTPEMFYPKPVEYSKVTGEMTGIKDFGSQPTAAAAMVDTCDILENNGRIKSAMLEDIANGDADVIPQFLEMFGEFRAEDKRAIKLINADFNLEVLG